MGEISSLPRPYDKFLNDEVEFLVDDRGKKVRCRITHEELTKFGRAEESTDPMEKGTSKPFLDLFNSNRSRIEEIARKKIDAREFEPDGTILVRSD